MCLYQNSSSIILIVAVTTSYYYANCRGSKASDPLGMRLGSSMRVWELDVTGCWKAEWPLH